MSRHRTRQQTKTPRPARRGRSRGYLALSVALLAVAALTIGRYLAQSPPPPTPPTALGTIPAAMTSPARNPPPPLRDPQANTDLTATGTVAPAPAPPLAPFSLKSSPPVSVHASTVGISSSLVQVGLNKDHTIEVPTSYAQAAWYRFGPTPGALGPAVIIGHVDSYQGPGVFFNLGDIRPGQVIVVLSTEVGPCVTGRILAPPEVVPGWSGGGGLLRCAWAAVDSDAEDGEDRPCGDVGERGGG